MEFHAMDTQLESGHSQMFSPEEKEEDKLSSKSNLAEKSTETVDNAKTHVRKTDCDQTVVPQKSHKRISKQKRTKTTPLKYDETGHPFLDRGVTTMLKTSIAEKRSILSQKLERCQLDPISVEPGPNAKTISIKHDESMSPRVIKLNQTFKFPTEFEGNFDEKASGTKESCTQTSKTFVCTAGNKNISPRNCYTNTASNIIQPTHPGQQFRQCSAPGLPIIPNISRHPDQVNDLSINPIKHDNMNAGYFAFPPVDNTLVQPPIQDVANYAFSVFIPQTMHSSCSKDVTNEQEDFCTIYPQRSDNKPTRVKRTPIATKRQSSFRKRSGHSRHMPWPPALMTAPKNSNCKDVCVPCGDQYQNKEKLHNAMSSTLKSRKEKMPTVQKPKDRHHTVVNNQNKISVSTSPDPRPRSEPFILPALNNQHLPELQILRRILPPYVAYSEPYDTVFTSPDGSTHFTNTSPQKPIASPTHGAPQTSYHDNEYDRVEGECSEETSKNINSKKYRKSGTHPVDKFSMSHRTRLSMAYRDNPRPGLESERKVEKRSSALAHRNPPRRPLLCLGSHLYGTKKSINPQSCKHAHSNIGKFAIASDSESTGTGTTSSSSLSVEAVSLSQALVHLNSADWEVAIQGMTEVMSLSRTMEYEDIEPEMLGINRRIIEMLRSSRPHACRLACEAAGELFVSMKQTKGPDFDEIVDLLLCKTADTSRLIRNDANVALDRMVTYIPPFHAIRALCSKGPGHKNPLVRCATVRLLVCIAVLAGTDNILVNNMNTCKRMLVTMSKFLMDKHLETRKYAERLFKMFTRNKYFEDTFYRVVDVDIINQLGKSLQRLCRK